ncbi:Protein of unknown function [Gryllus bimaculatus]|nr:Protein of unknown function [Gryllus bimaculatus]
MLGWIPSDNLLSTLAMLHALWWLHDSIHSHHEEDGEEVGGITGKDVDLITAKMNDAVYIPPNNDEMTDEENIDDDLLEKKNNDLLEMRRRQARRRKDGRTDDGVENEELGLEGPENGVDLLYTNVFRIWYAGYHDKTTEGKDTKFPVSPP